MELTGVGLFSGKGCTVRISRGEGPTGFVIPSRKGAFIPLSDMRPTTSLLSTRVVFGDFEVRTVEHCFAALAAHGAYDGVRLEVSALELPLLDGTAAPWSSAFAKLGLRAAAPRLRIAAPLEFVVRDSVYRFRPSERSTVTCVLRTDDPRLATEATWDGTTADFHERIAGARTFAFARDLETYGRLGATAHVDPSDVIVIGDTIHCAGRPFAADEPVRHKLLDLIGDLFAHGGPPLGEIHVIAPGHARTHEALDFAKAEGKIVPR